MVAGVAACGEDPLPRYDPVAEPAQARGQGWSPVHLDAEVRSIDGLGSAYLLAAGADEGRPLLLRVTDGTAEHLHTDMVDRYDGMGLRGITGDGLNIAATGANPATAGRPATLWLGDEYGEFWTGVPKDRQGRAPVWLEPSFDGEEDFRGVGVVRVGPEWRVHAWEAVDDWIAIDAGPQLYSREAPTADSLLVAETETSLVVAGDLADTPAASPGPPELWTIFSSYAYESDARWERVELSPVPDAITDLASWDIGFWVAGHDDLHPVLFDFDDTAGRPMDAPAVALDPRHPEVHLASVPWDGRVVLALQTREGPSVFHRDAGRWTEVTAPEGRLEDAAVVDDLVYLLVDGRLWYRPLPVPKPAPTASPAVPAPPAG